MSRTLHSGFIRSTELFSERPALEVEGRTVTYQQLFAMAASIAATLQQQAPGGAPPLTAVFAHRSATAFAGVLGALFRGHGYVPLNREFPPDRTRTMLLRSGCNSIVVDRDSSKQLGEILAPIEGPMLVLTPDDLDVAELRCEWPRHRFLGPSDLASPAEWRATAVPANSVAYLLFTSGSTGVPKGVMVSHSNVTHFIDVMVERYQISEEDRFSQNFALTFDLSVFDMFMAWQRGACVCCPNMKHIINPGRFIRASALTVWFSVPSVPVFMKRLGLLQPNRFPTLRWSLFCGEALPLDIVQDWTMAAPNAVLENLYGPTELTIACTVYRWDPASSPAECHLGLVPIGRPNPGMDAVIVRDDLTEVDPGGIGELLLAGPQLSMGYWQDKERTAAAFVVPDGKQSTYYRTGDRVRRPLAETQPIVYVGRLDHQIKILGHRLELSEVEAALKHQPGVDSAVAIGWPVTASGADGVVAFVTGTGLNEHVLRNSLSATLPAYAVPREIKVLPQFPLNANGKVDRKALPLMLEEKREPRYSTGHSHVPVESSRT